MPVGRAGAAGLPSPAPGSAGFFTNAGGLNAGRRLPSLQGGCRSGRWWRRHRQVAAAGGERRRQAASGSLALPREIQRAVRSLPAPPHAHGRPRQRVLLAVLALHLSKAADAAGAVPKRPATRAESRSGELAHLPCRYACCRCQMLQLESRRCHQRAWKPLLYTTTELAIRAFNAMQARSGCPVGCAGAAPRQRPVAATRGIRCGGAGNLNVSWRRAFIEE